MLLQLCAVIFFIVKKVLLLYKFGVWVVLLFVGSTVPYTLRRTRTNRLAGKYGITQRLFSNIAHSTSRIFNIRFGLLLQFGIGETLH